MQYSYSVVDTYTGVYVNLIGGVVVSQLWAKFSGLKGQLRLIRIEPNKWHLKYGISWNDSCMDYWFCNTLWRHHKHVRNYINIFHLWMQ